MKKFFSILAALVLCVSSVQAELFEPIEPQDKTVEVEQINGAKLYQENCAQCHGQLEETRIPNRRAARIASAIKNLGSMAKLKHLSALEILAIADILASNENSLAAR